VKIQTYWYFYATIPFLLADVTIYFKPKPKANSRKTRVWNIKKVKEQWGVDVCGNILSIHAIFGYDTNILA
jgi:hypothetical protein